MGKKKALFLAFAVSLLALASLTYMLLYSRLYTPPVVASISVNGTLYNAYIATTPAQQEHGLMNMSSMGDCYGHGRCIGMLFIFANGSAPCFWMKDTRIALRQYWIRNNTITSTEYGVPYSTNVTCHAGDWVLETGQSSNFSVGQRVTMGAMQS